MQRICRKALMGWLEATWGSIFGPKRCRLMYQIEGNMVALKMAADDGRWDIVAGLVARQERLIDRFLACEGSEQELMAFINARKRVTWLDDEELRGKIAVEAAKRGVF